MKKIVIFGGTFDPVHIGHLKIYLVVKKQLHFDKFLVVPSKHPPLKNNQAYASAEDRFMMTKLLFGKYKDVKIERYEIDKNDNKVSYTINTIRYLSKKYPNDKLFLVVGLDRYDDFKQWKNWQEILKLVTLIVIPRHKLINKTYTNCVTIKMPLINVASSQLRSNPNHKFIPKQIINYIAQNGLYINQQIKPLLSKARYEHTLRVAKLALEIAKAIKYKFLKKVYIAAMYHDVCKEFDDKKIIKYAQTSHKHIHILHGVAGANYIKKHFNVNDRDILEAISSHVIPNKTHSLLTKILYCADKLEPSRTKKDIQNRLGMIRLVKKDINKYFYELLSITQQKYKN